MYGGEKKGKYNFFQILDHSELGLGVHVEKSLGVGMILTSFSIVYWILTEILDLKRRKDRILLGQVLSVLRHSYLVSLNLTTKKEIKLAGFTLKAPIKDIPYCIYDTINIYKYNVETVRKRSFKENRNLSCEKYFQIHISF